MRDAFCRAMIEVGRSSGIVFFTGDLGFQALEPLRESLGGRFVNAGVAEQNMVSVAAGVAGEGQQAWVYSIAPFVYARPFEQVRNDVCLHGLDVKLVGNGGGYGYGSMGATHHALEDLGVLLTLTRMRAFVPSFDEDVDASVRAVGAYKGPAYLRLGRGEKPAGWEPPAYAPWRRLLGGDGPVVVALGPLAGVYLCAWQGLPEADRPELWALCELPVGEPPAEFLAAVRVRGHVAVAEEHVAHGGVGSALALWLATRARVPARFDHFHARGYPSGTYGSQQFHRAESGLDPGSVLNALGPVSR